MRASELAGLVGKQGAIRTAEGLTFAVTITDARTRFGILDYLVVPQAGIGEAWVESRRVQITGADA